MSKVKTKNFVHLESYIAQAIRLLESTDNTDLHNDIYQRLLNYCTMNSELLAEDFLLKSDLNSLLLDKFRCLRADYVFTIESEWARKIIANKESISGLKKIAYFKNYHNMVKNEFKFINDRSKKPIKKVAFIGSGPFPFTSFCLAKDYGIKVVNVDIDSEALETSMELADKLGIGGFMEYVCCDARNMNIDNSFDAVIVAALVGHHANDKHDIINSLAKSLSNNQLLAARTAIGIKQLFYVGVSRENVDLRYIGISMAEKEIINSLMLFEKS